MRVEVLTALAPAALLLFGAGGSRPGDARGEPVDFGRDIQPILEERCFSCHGPEKQKGRLRLDSRAAALAASRFGDFPVIRPGSSAESELWLRVSAGDPEDRMPPEGEPLTAQQLDLLRRWIDAGASFGEHDAAPAVTAKHWAYVAPERPAPPELADGALATSPIDRFVRARLASEGLTPSPRADRATLLRRASLDLTGLPPALEELDAFLADETPEAFARAVDRLLASPRYAEHQARWWLDLARYADTNGYEKDARRPMWRWRDWVIAAFDADMPFDRFTVEQLAGDLLPDATIEQRVATGFHRNTMVNREGGTDPEEFRAAAVVDRVNTTASVWLGSTLACAQCHDHKYDPFSQEEYFQLYAFFDGTTDTGNELDPVLEAPTTAQQRALPEMRAEMRRLERQLATWTPALETDFLRWKQRVRAELPAWRVLHPLEFRSEAGNPAEVLADGSVLVGGEAAAKDTYALVLDAPEGPVTALRVEVLEDPSLPKGGPGRAGHQNFVLSELRASVRPEVRARVAGLGAEPEPVARPLRLRDAWADHHQTGSPSWPPAAAIDGDAGTGWAIAGGYGQSHQLVLALEEPLELDGLETLVVELEQAYGSQHLIGRLRVSATADELPGEPAVLAPELERAVAAGRTTGARVDDRLRERFLARTPRLDPERARLAELREASKAPRTLVMQERATPRETRVHVGGSFLSPGELVTPGVPAVLGAFPADAPPNRLGLAQWLVARENPLTARVTVNRVWERLYGRGLVSTSADFGTQGEEPTHAELLDWLAVDFMERGWSLKELYRTILASHTWQQSSVVRPELLARDPQNLLLARAPRLRVEAEVVRDLALAASGLLVEELGGPSVFPPQPEGTWGAAYSDDQWIDARDAGRWRRGLYTFWRRTAHYPTFMLFDAPSRELACTRRPRTNTPLQALAVLNDPAFVEAAGALARRALREADADAARLERAFRLCTARRPEPEEERVLLELLAAERAHYAGDAEAARRLAEGEGLLPAEGHDPTELAAWTVVANALLNLDETLTRE